jgi:hypothetical protein
MPAASVVLGLVLVAAPAAYCTGQPITSESGVPRYPNGQRVVDGFGKEYYPNGARLTNDYGDGFGYSNAPACATPRAPSSIPAARPPSTSSTSSPAPSTCGRSATSSPPAAPS